MSDWRSARVAGRPWQDLVFALTQVVFIVALAPLFFTSVPTYTGLSTGSALLLFSVCQYSYRNYLTLVLNTATALAWIALGLGA